MNYRDYQAFLHIVHVSDMHCRDGSSPTDLRAERAVQRLARQLRRTGAHPIADWLESSWEQGLAGHDPSVHDRMCRFLRWFAADRHFGGIECWLLDTGDLSSMGDLGSLDTAKRWLDDYCRIVRATRMLVLYGNHDAWPCRFPLAAPRAELEAHRNALRSRFFPPSWPQGPLAVDIPHTRSRLLLSGVNSAIDDRWFNTWAYGSVERDPHWISSRGVHQLQKLADDTERGFHRDLVTRDFRILAVHHPVHYPQRPPFGMALRNADEVADALIAFDRRQRGKLAHLVLSGHTHAPFPALGALPRYAKGQHLQPLTDGQLQLIAGSLSQMPRAADRAACRDGRFVPHQFQVLTFFAPPVWQRHHHHVLMERRIVGRPGGTGDFRILVPPGGHVESVLMEY